MSVESVPPEADALGRALGHWFEELEQMLGEDGPPEAWMREPAAPVFGQLDGEALPLVDARGVAAGVFDGGRLTAATRAFTDGRCAELVDRDLLSRMAAGAEPTYLAIPRSDADPAATGLIAYAPGRRTATWRLPPEIHAAAQGGRKPVVVLTTMVEESVAPLRDACLAYGLTGLQTRVALETIRVGAIKEAAENLGLS